MMGERERQMRRTMSKAGWGAIVYIITLNVGVFFAALLLLFLRGQAFSMQAISSLALSDGWAYMLAVVVGVGILIGSSNRRLRHQYLHAHEARMTLRAGLVVIAALLAVQLITEICGVGIETVLNHFGLSALDQMREASKLGVRSGSMMLYAGLCGPICEELVFRGFILRRLQPLGTKLAIVVSAVLFACAHGNVIQTPFAFITGLLLGYIAVHYGIKWSIAAHIFNNLGLSIGLQLLMKDLHLPFLTVALTLLSIAALIWLVVRYGRKALAWWQAERIHRGNLMLALSRLPVIIMYAYALAMIVGGIQAK